MKVEIIMFCHNFQRRLCWLLSSIHQQTGDTPDTLVNIACIPQDGYPTTELVAFNFGKRGLNIKLTHVTKKELAQPSLTKNRQIAESDADWLMAWSADQILATDYMATLKFELENGLENHKGCLVSTLKKMADRTHTESLMADNPDTYIQDAFEKINTVPRCAKKQQLHHRAGGHLLFSRSSVMNKCNGMYAIPGQCPDRHLFRRGMKTRSDMSFRARMGVTKRIDLPMSIHMGHNRDKENGKHIEEQR